MEYYNGKRRFMYAVSIFTLLLSAGLLLLIIYWLIFPYKILTFGARNGKIDAGQVRGGEYVEIFQSSCKWMDIPATINRQFINNIIYIVPTIHSNRPVNCTKDDPKPKERYEQVYVPKALEPGMYYINTVISFKVNPIRTVTYTVATTQFEVVK